MRLGSGDGQVSWLRYLGLASRLRYLGLASFVDSNREY